MNSEVESLRDRRLGQWLRTCPCSCSRNPVSGWTTTGAAASVPPLCLCVPRFYTRNSSGVHDQLYSHHQCEWGQCRESPHSKDFFLSILASRGAYPSFRSL